MSISGSERTLVQLARVRHTHYAARWLTLRKLETPAHWKSLTKGGSLRVTYTIIQWKTTQRSHESNITQSNIMDPTGKLQSKFLICCSDRTVGIQIISNNRNYRGGGGCQTCAFLIAPETDQDGTEVQSPTSECDTWLTGKRAIRSKQWQSNACKISSRHRNSSLCFPPWMSILHPERSYIRTYLLIRTVRVKKNSPHTVRNQQMYPNSH